MEVPIRRGRYTLVEPLSREGWGTVYRADLVNEEGSRKRFAVRLIQAGGSVGSAVTARLVEMARIVTGLSHHNIVQTIECARDGLDLIVVMDFVSGLSLKDLLHFRAQANRPLPLAVAVDLARGLCEGLTCGHHFRDLEGHAHPLVHGSFDPSHVLVDVHGVPRIRDFGIAGALADIRRELVDLAPSRSEYQPPETTPDHPDPRDDLYAFGAVLFELLTSQPLFLTRESPEGEGGGGRVDLEHRLKALALGPSVLYRLVRRLVDPDRGSRPSSAREVAIELGSISAHLARPREGMSDIVAEALIGKDGRRIPSAPPTSSFLPVSTMDLQSAIDASHSGRGSEPFQAHTHGEEPSRGQDGKRDRERKELSAATGILSPSESPVRFGKEPMGTPLHLPDSADAEESRKRVFLPPKPPGMAVGWRLTIIGVALAVSAFLVRDAYQAWKDRELASAHDAAGDATPARSPAPVVVAGSGSIKSLTRDIIPVSQAGGTLPFQPTSPRPTSTAPVQVQTGFLTVNSIPRAKVILDGKDLGVTPLRRVPVPSGVHSLRMVTRDGEKLNPLSITVPPDQELDLKTLSFDE